MNKTLRISFSLRNTYRVNSILFSLKQIPLIGRLFPETLYQEPGLKIFANLISALWEVLSAVIGKAAFFLLLFFGASLYSGLRTDFVFLHLFLICTIAGSYVNTYLFNPTRDKYYALVLLRMDARAYTLVNYAYAMGKLLLTYLVFGLLFGRMAGLPLWQCLLLPFSAAGMKLTVAALDLLRYERTDSVPNENKGGKLYWISLILLLSAAFGLPSLGIFLPLHAGAVLLVLSSAACIPGLIKVLRFPSYRLLYQELLSASAEQIDKAKTKQANLAKTQSKKAISMDTSVTSSRKGFKYLNELFIKRHKKILWKAAEKVASVCLLLVLGTILVMTQVPKSREVVNAITLQWLPYFTFIMYAINRGTSFTQALFINCDNSLLTYPFYKKSRPILQLFRIRLTEIVKINLLPAFIIGTGLAALLYLSGGTGNPVNYAVLIVSIACMSIFFSVHYLTIYYLLQPYTAGAELKSGTYRLVSMATYVVCYILMRVRMSTIVFGLLTIVFCVAYSLIACVLVYRLAPKTFKIRA